MIVRETGGGIDPSLVPELLTSQLIQRWRWHFELYPPVCIALDYLLEDVVNAALDPYRKERDRRGVQYAGVRRESVLKGLQGDEPAERHNPHAADWFAHIDDYATI